MRIRESKDAFRRGGLLLGAAFSLFSISAALAFAPRARAEEGVDYERRMNATAFPDTLQKDSLPLGVGDRARVRKIQNEILQVVGFNPTYYFRAVTKEAAPKPLEQKRIVQAMRALEYRICGSEGTDLRCEVCGTGANACVKSKKAGGTIGLLAYLSPCLLQAKGACAKYSPKSLPEAIEGTLASAAYLKWWGQPSDGKARAAAGAGSDAIRWIAKNVNSVLGACPAGYSKSDRDFLGYEEHLRRANDSLSRCASAYQATLRRATKECAFLRTPAELARGAKAFWTPYRCDEFCQTLLCRPKWDVAWLTRFGSDDAIVLPDGACEGDKPQKLDTFVRYLFRADAGAAKCSAKLGIKDATGAGGKSDGVDAGVSGLPETSKDIEVPGL